MRPRHPFPTGDTAAPEDPLALARQFPAWSAVVPLTRLQRAGLAVGAIALAALSLFYPWTVARGFILLATLFYTVTSLYKLALVRFSVSRNAEIRIPPAESAALDAGTLPVYSILVPMMHEPESVEGLVRALDALDYPADRRDVQLLLEEDDTETRAVAERMTLPEGFRITRIPPSHPRTKPKACNLGLARARGEFLVIYDAEDRPERDQLRKAVAAFRRVPDDVACLQCRLNFYNPRQNLLTRWFTAEYSAWFDLCLPGLAALRAVIPLGGTSNHFRTDVLRRLCGWDAYNVTEDCDLGVRLHRTGWSTRMLEATTWEEACSSLPYWIRQRTRWLKGYLQTYLVHMRRPLRLLRDLGPAGFFHFQTLIGGVVLTLLINPLFWALALLWMVYRTAALAELFPGMVFVLGALCLFAGNFVFVYIGAIACYRRGYFDLLRTALLAPFYWVLMSVSAWRAFLQFFANPFHWEKTRHGLASSRPS